MSICKKLSIVVLITIMIFVSCPLIASAEPAGSTPEFGQGYNNFEDSDGKLGGILAAIFQMNGVEIDGYNYQGDISAAEAWSKKAVSALHKADREHSLADWLNENVEFIPDAGTGLSKIKLNRPLGEFWGLPGMDDFLGYLFGSSALTGDPFDTEIQSNQYITINGEDYMVWKSDVNFVGTGNSIAARSLSENNIVQRGDFIVPNDGAYGTTFNNAWNGKDNWNNTWSLPRLEYTKSNGSTASFGPGEWKVYQGTSSLQGAYKELQVKVWTYYTVYFTSEAGQDILFAYMPVVTPDNRLCMCIYSYIYSGSDTWTNYDNGYVLTWWIKGDVPQYSDAGATFDVVAPDGFQFINIEEGDEITVNANTYNEIVNKYIDNSLTINYNTPEPGGTPPDWQYPDTPEFPGIDLPDLNDIDWSINGLKEHFPFSIPYDLREFFRYVDAEPVTPHLDGTIDLIITEWTIDWDFHDFDELAALLRRLEFILFGVGLFVSTKNMLY